MQDVKLKLIDIFNSTLNKKFSENDVAQINKNDLQEWDSIQNIILFQRINAELGLTIKTDEFLMCLSFDDIVKLILNAD
jgi:acyl carrier protein